MSTRSIISYGFLTVIVILITATSVGLFRVQQLTGGLERVVKEREGQMMLLHTMRHAAREQSILLQSMLLHPEPSITTRDTLELQNQTGKYKQASDVLQRQTLTHIDNWYLERLHKQSLETDEAQQQMLDALLADNQTLAGRILQEAILPGQRISMDLIDEFIRHKRNQNVADLEKLAQHVDSTYAQMIALGLCGMLFSLGMAYLIGKRINTEMVKRIASENGLRHSELRERTIRENIIDGILTLSRSGTILSCNRACHTIFGCDPADMIGRKAHMLLPTSFSEQSPLDLERHLKVWEKRLNGSGIEVIGLRKDQSEFPAEVDVSSVELDGESTYIVVVRDITEKKASETRLQQFNRELEQQVAQRTAALAKSNTALRKEIDERIRAQQELTHLASHDSLTNLPNRAFFTEQLTTTLFHAKRRSNLLALLFMDLDGFKQVNDTHGHEAGDRLLIEVSNRMKDAVRKEDIVARMGGDEFTVLLNELSRPADAERIAMKIIEAINHPISCGDIICRVGISIGIAYFPYHGDSPDALLRQADDAMYAAKASGKNCYSSEGYKESTVSNAS